MESDKTTNMECKREKVRQKLDKFIDYIAYAVHIYKIRNDKSLF